MGIKFHSRTVVSRTPMGGREQIDMENKYGDKWKMATDDSGDSLKFDEGLEIMKRSQDPSSFDKIAKIENDLDDVKQTVLKSMDDVLKRGENLDQLMAKSEDLSTTSHQFY